MDLYHKIYVLEKEEFEDVRISSVLKPMAMHMVKFKVFTGLGSEQKEISDKK